MRAVVTIVFNARQSLELAVDPNEQALTPAQARDWLEQQWVALGCEPLRPSGKVLLLDKIMGVADALGYRGLQEQTELAQRFASACVQAVQASSVTIDLPGLSVNY